MVKGAYSLPPDWESAIGGWLDWLRVSGHSEPTIYTRRGHVRATARMLHMRHPDDVTTQHLVILYAGQRWSQEHRRGLRTSMIQFFDYCVERDICGVNPARGLPRVPEDSPRPRPAPEWLWEELVATTPPRELLMVRLAGEVGLRRAEIAQVHRNDVVWDGDGWSLIVNGKGGKQRVVPINTRLAEQLQRGPHWLPDGVGGGYLFPSIDRWGNFMGRHLTADRVGRLISRLMPDGFTAHKLRHRYATRGFAGTKNLRAVQEALGHASVATTQRYTAVSSPEVRAVAEAVVATF